MPGHTQEDRGILLAIAREAIAAHVTGTARGGDGAAVPDLTAAAAGSAGVFVTLHEDGQLRGCIGHMDPDEPLVEALVDAAVAACSRDPRFAPVSRDELSRISIELSILGPLEPVTTVGEIEIGRHGLLVEQGHRRGLLLPQVSVEHRWTAATFVAHTCRKAGLPEHAWPGDAVLWRFEAEVFSEPHAD